MRPRQSHPERAPCVPPACRAALDFYRCFQKVFVDPPSGEVVLRFHRTDVVRIRPAGDVMLHTGGHFTQ